MAVSFQQLQQASVVLASYGVRKAALFGSQARGDARPDSDVDVLIEPNGEIRLFDLSALQCDLEEVFQKDVDVSRYKNVRPEIIDSALSDEKVFFVDGKTIDQFTRRPVTQL